MKDTTVKKIDSALLEPFAGVETTHPPARAHGRDEA
jgi:hypothetical protein